MVELELGAVDLGHVEVGQVEATDDEEEERAEDDTEDQPAPQRRPVAVAGLGIEVVFAALPVVIALVVVMVWQIVFHWRKMACAGSARIDISRQITDARRHPSLWLCKTWRSGCSSHATRPTLGQGYSPQPSAHRWTGLPVLLRQL